MTSAPDERAIDTWLVSAGDLFKSASDNLELQEWDVFLDRFVGYIAGHYGRRLEELRGQAPLLPADRVIGPRAVIEIPIEARPRLRFEGTTHGEISRLRDWIGSDYDLVHLVDAALTLARA